MNTVLLAMGHLPVVIREQDRMAYSTLSTT